MTSDRTEKEAGKDLGLSLVDTLKHSELASVTRDLAEVSIDLLLQQPDILRDIPVLGTLAGVWSAGLAVRDYLFTKKLVSFLHALHAVPPDRRLRMVQKLEGDPAFGRKVGEDIMLLLDRLDTVSKAALVGKAFKAYCEGSIDSATLQRVNHAVDRIPLIDLHKLPAFLNNSPSVSATTKQAFVNGGLAYIPEAMASTTIEADRQLCADLVMFVLQ